MADIDPAAIEVLRSGGTGNMGSVSTESSVARFKLDADRFALVDIRGTFTGGSGSADLAIKIDHVAGSQFDATLQTISGVGTGGDQLHFRVMPNEIPHFIVDRGSIFVCEWTNPNTQTWGLEVFLVRVT